MSTKQTQPMLRPRAGVEDLFKGPPANRAPMPGFAARQAWGGEGSPNRPNTGSPGGYPPGLPEQAPPQPASSNFHENCNAAEPPALPIFEQYKWVVIGLIAIIVALVLIWYFFFKQPTVNGEEGAAAHEGVSEEEEQKNAQMREAIARRQEMERQRRLAALNQQNAKEEEPSSEEGSDGSGSDDDAAGENIEEIQGDDAEAVPRVASEEEPQNAIPPEESHDAPPAKQVHFAKPEGEATSAGKSHQAPTRAKPKRILRGGRRK